MKWIVFIAKTKKGRLFTGVTAEKENKKYNIIYREIFSTQFDAKMREKSLNKLSKNFKIEVTARKILHA